MNKVFRTARFWTGADVLAKPMSDRKKMKITQAFILAGPIGHYLIECCSTVKPVYREAYHGIIRMVTKVLYRGFTEREMPAFHRESLVVLVTCVIMFPLHFNRITHHHFSHTWGPTVDGAARELGPVLGWCLLGAGCNLFCFLFISINV